MFWDDLITSFQYLKRAYMKDEERLFARVCTYRTRGNDIKLKANRFRLDIRMKFFTIGLVSCPEKLRMPIP